MSPDQYRRFLAVFLTLLFGTLTVQSALGQLEGQTGSTPIADARTAVNVHVQTEADSRNALSEVDAPRSTRLTPTFFDEELATESVQEEEMPALNVGSTSLRSALLHGNFEVEEQTEQRDLRRELVNQPAMAAQSPMAFPRQALMGLSQNGSFSAGSDATRGRTVAPRIGLALDDVLKGQIDPGNEGVVLMSIGF